LIELAGTEAGNVGFLGLQSGTQVTFTNFAVSTFAAQNCFSQLMTL
jgi:hypothetical protein